MTLGYVLESIVEIVNDSRATVGLPPIGESAQLWGKVPKVLFDEYVPLRAEFRDAQPHERRPTASPMILLFPGRMLNLTPAVREEGRRSLHLICSALGLTPADVYAQLGGSGGVEGAG